ncbi:MAG TPA: GAF domain-containing protein [Anaerolineae bacterium]|nr:GAF domain-containing protein [Anaerolineae bacterium]
MFTQPTSHDSLSALDSHTYTKVLLIDEQEANYDDIKQYLHQSQLNLFALDWVSSQAAGLEAILSGQYEAALVTYSSNCRACLDFIQRVRQAQALIPLIALIDNNEPDVGLQTLAQGAADYLFVSQLGPQLLERSINQAIEHSRTIRASEGPVELPPQVDPRSAELAELQLKLAQEIAERDRLEREISQSLKRRARQVQTITEIAQKIAGCPKLGDLFDQVVHLVQEQFGYYHAQVFTLEDGHLVAQQGTGSTGAMMKSTGHRIPLEATRSLVARAARSGQPVLSIDVFASQDWLPNNHLPETRSELTVPIKLNDDVLGVLDVQSDMVAGLDEEDQIMLMGLCGQIAVAINNRRLEDEREQAQEAQQKLLDDLDLFAHVIGYTVRDPLSLIIGYTDLLKTQAALPDRLYAYLNAIAANGLKLGSIINELQVLTGIRHANIEWQPLNMVRIIAEVEHRLTYLIREYEAKITISEYWPLALGHKPWIEEVWANYLTNAIKYGGRPPRIYVGATALSTGQVRFWVRDNGPGLSPAEQTRIFTKFAGNLQDPVTEQRLRLATVKSIVTKLGGYVGVESAGQPGHGSLFSFTLPQA